MALPYEQLSEDLRRTERLKRQRAREAWKRETALQKYLYNLGTVTALALEDQEDNVLRLVALEAEGKSVLLAGMRRTAKDLLEIYSQINAANIYDFNLVEQRFGGKTSVEGLSDEKQKFLSKPYKGEGVCLELDPDFLHFTGGVFPGWAMQAYLQMPGAGGQGYSQPNFGQGGGDMYGGGHGTGSTSPI
jgi:hypothetical protein